MSTIRRGTILAPLLGLVAGSIFAQGQASIAPSTRIGGVVIDAVTGEAMKRVRIAISPYGQQSSERSLITGDDGRFLFESVLPGKYELTAEKRGRPRQKFGMRGLASGFGVSIVVGANMSAENLVFRFYPASAIIGKVTDEAGEPVKNALIQLLRSAPVSGRRRVRTLGWVYTNDLGEYRFAPVGAGSYYLAVTRTPWYAEGAYGTHTLNKGYQARFYPDTDDPRTATPLVLKTGQEVRADFSLSPVFGASILVDFSSPEIKAFGASQPASLYLTTEGVQGAETYYRIESSRGTMPRFYAVPPGRYELRLMIDEGDHSLFARQSVDVSGSDVTVKLTPQRAPSVAGDVYIEDGSTPPAGRLLVRFEELNTRHYFARSVSANGGFAAPYVPPGRYQLSFAGVRAIYLKSVFVYGRQSSGPEIDVPEGSALHLRLIGGADAGRVSGTIFLDNTPFPGALVVLIPQDGSKKPDYYRSFQSDSDGSYDFEGIPPGDYQLFATDDFDLEYANVAVVRNYLAASKPVHVEPMAARAFVSI